MLSISHLFTYPIKSLKGISIDKGVLTDRGLQYDRRWLLVDENYRFLTQREYSQMALINTVIENDELIVFHNEDSCNKYHIPLQPVPSNIVTVCIWNDVCKAQLISPSADEWFSEVLKVKCHLVYMPDNSKREVEETDARQKGITSFADDYPILIIGQSSLDDLNSRLIDSLPMERFRPNIVFKGADPFEEDTMEHFTIKGISFYAVKACARCVISTINQQTGVAGKEPLKTLSTYRKANNKIYFGQNVLSEERGIINVGDEIKIISTKPALLLTG